MIIKNGYVHSRTEGFVAKDIFTEAGYFSSSSSDGIVVDASNCYVIPGLVDVHFHGCDGADFSDGTKDALETIGAYELKNGTTTICPASMTASPEQLMTICKNALAYTKAEHEAPVSRLCGIHLEGPFIALSKKGAQNPDYIIPPSRELFEQLYDTSEGLVKLITLAPELPGSMDFIKKLSSRVHISLGHTDCDYDIASEAFSLGADHVTHTFNAMNPFLHRAPGIIGAASEHQHVFPEIICDGIHVHAAAVKGALKLFGTDRLVFISDSMRATGLQDGDYELGGLPVIVKGRYATLKDGTLAGSASNLLDCVKVAFSMGIPFEDAVTCASYNPAHSIGIEDRYGSIEIGKAADCVLLDKETLAIKCVIKDGKEVA